MQEPTPGKDDEQQESSEPKKNPKPQPKGTAFQRRGTEKKG